MHVGEMEQSERSRLRGKKVIAGCGVFVEFVLMMELVVLRKERVG